MDIETLRTITYAIFFVAAILCGLALIDITFAKFGVVLIIVVLMLDAYTSDLVISEGKDYAFTKIDNCNDCTNITEDQMWSKISQICEKTNIKYSAYSETSCKRDILNYFDIKKRINSD